MSRCLLLPPPPLPPEDVVKARFPNDQDLLDALRQGDSKFYKALKKKLKTIDSEEFPGLEEFLSNQPEVNDTSSAMEGVRSFQRDNAQTVRAHQMALTSGADVTSQFCTVLTVISATVAFILLNYAHF